MFVDDLKEYDTKRIHGILDQKHFLQTLERVF